MAAPPVLRAEGLTKRFGAREVVSDLSLQVDAGEILGFLGPNGAGKTTTIRMLVGLIRPTQGRIWIAGHDLRTELEDALRRVGCIVESPDLYGFLTGRENLEHFARMMPEIASGEVERVSAIVDLSHRLEDKVKTYSLGMRQRLGIAQALLGQPELLILDEPANGLDPAGIREMRELLRSLARDHGLGILVSSHLLAEIEMVCDRVTILHRGRVLSSGPVSLVLGGTARWRLDVDRADAATAVLAGRGVEAVRNNGWLEFEAEREGIPDLIRALVAEGVAISTVEPRRATLEERFLSETHGESV